MDIKKQARIPPGGGWRVNGLANRTNRPEHKDRVPTGYAYIHSIVDAYSRLAYSEVLNNEQAITMMAFSRRALAFFKQYGITVERVLTDNGSCYRSKDLTKLLVADSITQPSSGPIGLKQRQGRALQPNVAQRVGLRPALSIRSLQDQGAGHLAPYLQPSSAPHGHRWPARQPNQQPGGAEHLGQERTPIEPSGRRWTLGAGRGIVRGS